MPRILKYCSRASVLCLMCATLCFSPAPAFSELQTDPWSEWLTTAKERLAEKDYSGLLAAGQEIIRMNPSNPSGYIFAATALWNFQSFSDIIFLTLLAERNGIRDPFLFQMKAYSMFAAGNFRHALRALCELEKILPPQNFEIPDASLRETAAYD